MKIALRVMFYVSVVLIIYGIVAAVLGLNFIMQSPKFADAAIFIGAGLAIMIARYEVLMDKLNKDIAGFKLNLDEMKRNITGNIESFQASITRLLSDVALLQTKDAALESSVVSITKSFESGIQGLQNRVGTLELLAEGSQTRIGGLETNVNKLLTDFGGMHESFGGLHEEVGKVHGGLSEIHKDFESVHNELGGLHKELGDILKKGQT
jgi:Mg2+ and Co2+ transporter CorA